MLSLSNDSDKFRQFKRVRQSLNPGSVWRPHPCFRYRVVELYGFISTPLGQWFTIQSQTAEPADTNNISLYSLTEALSFLYIYLFFSSHLLSENLHTVRESVSCSWQRCESEWLDEVLSVPFPLSSTGLCQLQTHFPYLPSSSSLSCQSDFTLARPYLHYLRITIQGEHFY